MVSASAHTSIKMLGICRRQTGRLTTTSWQRYAHKRHQANPEWFPASTYRCFGNDSINSNNSSENGVGNGNNDDDNDNKNDSTSTVPIIHVPTKMAGDDAPRTPHVLALPVVNRPLFPGSPTTITLTDEDTIHALDSLKQTNDAVNRPSYVSVFLRREYPNRISEGGVILPPEVISDPSDVHQVGTFAEIKIHRFPGFASSNPNEGLEGGDTKMDDGSGNLSDNGSDDDDKIDSTASVTLFGHRRVDLLSIDEIGPPIDATVNHWPRLDYTGVGSNSDTIRALSNEVFAVIREVATINIMFRNNLQLFSSLSPLETNDPYRLADFTASVCSAAGKSEDLQEILEAKDPEERLHKALVLLNREKEVAKLQQEISSKVEEKMSEAQRRYFLTEQLKSIKKELGMEKDDKEALIAKYRKQLLEYREVPDEVMIAIDQELEKLSTLEMNSSEYNVTRSYLDWLVGVPWGIVSDENFDIRSARRVLDRDHYGLNDVKDTILEFIAVGKLRGTVKGKIVCLAGPPGTG